MKFGISRTSAIAKSRSDAVCPSCGTLTSMISSVMAMAKTASLKNTIRSSCKPFESCSIVILKDKCFVVFDRRLKFQKVTGIFAVVFRLFDIVAGEPLDAFVAVPFGHRPEVTHAAVDLPPYLDAQVAFHRLIIRDPRFDQ